MVSAQVDQRIRHTAFLAAPISDNYDRVTSELRTALGKSGIHTTLVDDLNPGTNISDQIMEAFLQSDFVIADIVNRQGKLAGG